MPSRLTVPGHKLLFTQVFLVLLLPYSITIKQAIALTEVPTQREDVVKVIIVKSIVSSICIGEQADWLVQPLNIDANCISGMHFNTRSLPVKALCLTLKFLRMHFILKEKAQMHFVLSQK